jgi:hypothetical protein
MQPATITIVNKITGNRKTFRVKNVVKGNLIGKQIIELMNGPDNEKNYVGFGFVESNKIKVWSKCQQDFQKFVPVCEHAFGIKEHNFNSLEIHYSANCCKCNRKLTTPESIAMGIGPECAKRN